MIPINNEIASKISMRVPSNVNPYLVNKVGNTSDQIPEEPYTQKKVTPWELPRYLVGKSSLDQREYQAWAPKPAPSPQRRAKKIKHVQFIPP